MPSVQTSFRILTWCCVILLAVLSLLPAQDMVRTGIPGELEHFVAYAGSTTIAMSGYGQRRGTVRIIGSFWLYAGVLEYLQHFSPGRHRQSPILRRRRSERCSEGSPCPYSCVACGQAHIRTSPDSM